MKLCFSLRSLAVLCCSLFLSASLNSQHVASDPGVAQLEKDLPDLMHQADVPGVAIAMLRHGKLFWQHNFGVKNTKTNEPVTDNTIFEAASLSKPVFTYAVLKLVDQGKLGLDVPLSTYLPKSERGSGFALANPELINDPQLAKITARIVLSHRTGFRNWRNDEGLKIYFTPGERFSYSGEGYVYLQTVIEQITGKPLNDVMNELVFTPLGMTSSSYVWRPAFDSAASTGHDFDGHPGDHWKPDHAVSASSLNTTAHDYALFLAAILNGTGLKPSTLREMETPQIAVDPECTNCTDHAPKQLSKNIFWGLGWGIERNGKSEVLWHWGDNGAFKCFVVSNPARKFATIMFTNSENGLAIAPAVFRDATGSTPLAFTWLKYDAYDSDAFRFAKTAHDSGVDAAIRQFDAPLKSGAIPESAINSLGYRLLRQKRSADAISIFQLNVDLHPQSANTYDSLAEAYMDSGDKTLAIQFYEKSLALDRKNQNAADQLKKLRATKD